MRFIVANTFPKVSIVISTYNEEKYIRTTLDHVMFQDYPNMEIIVVDGGSTDSTPQLLKQYQQELAKATSEVQDGYGYDKEHDKYRIIRRQYKKYPDRRISFIRFEKNIGATRAINEGFKRTTGDYVMYLVGDDIPHTMMVKRLIETIITYDADFVYADQLVVNSEGHVIQGIRRPEYSFEACFAQCYNLGNVCLFRRLLGEKVGWMNPDFIVANDYDFYLRVAMTGCKFVNVPEYLYSMRQPDMDNPSNQHTSERILQGYKESYYCMQRAREFSHSPCPYENPFD